MKITGRCHCNKITYEAEIDLDNIVICHCTDCQTLSGSAFRTVAMTKTGAFKLLTGTPKIYVKIGDSGNEREQSFCPECGSPIYSTSTDDGPRIYGIRLGTVDQRSSISPLMQKWIGSCQRWTQDIAALPLSDKD